LRRREEPTTICTKIANLKRQNGAAGKVGGVTPARSALHNCMQIADIQIEVI